MNLFREKTKAEKEEERLLRNGMFIPRECLVFFEKACEKMRRKGVYVDIKTLDKLIDGTVTANPEEMVGIKIVNLETAQDYESIWGIVKNLRKNKERE